MKAVSMQVVFRDPLDPTQIIGSESAEGTTNDDGATVVIPLGYLPNILSAAPGDILRTVHQPSVEVPPPSSLPARTDDPLADPPISTLSFS